MTRETLQERLDLLTPAAAVRFGIMTPQHMLEHLILTLKLSSGRIPMTEFVPNEKQLAQKQALLYTDIPFPQGIKVPGIPDTLMELRFPDLTSAKAALLASWDAYQDLFQQEPGKTTIHPRFGPLNHADWEKFHAKHMDHHLGQFGV
jgi:oxepin-CoA hydrolase/3-oxo-5,6-dehydrosuberyl-CoA semialdehyde dehydrogenase